MAPKKGLGKGLDSLIPKVSSAEIETNEKGGVATLKIDTVEPNKAQPRKYFDKEKLEELASSIKQNGIVEPLLVQKKGDYYEIVAGERRWRAAKLAGLDKVPVIIKELTDQQVFEISLIENIQREQLNPIEEALAYKRLQEEFSLKQEEVAERVSKSRSVIANAMRLLNLDERVQEMVITSELSMGHARAIVGIKDTEKQYDFARRAIEEKLTVRDVEKQIREDAEPKAPKKKSSKVMSEQETVAFTEAEERLKQILGTKVMIHAKEKGRGSIEIEYYTEEQLDSLLETLEG